MSLEDPWKKGVDFVLGVLRQRQEWGDESLQASASALEGLRRSSVRPISAGEAVAREMPESAARVAGSREGGREDTPTKTPGVGGSPRRVEVEAFSGAALSGDRGAALAALRAEAARCERCPHLVRSRFSVVFGEGNPEAELMFVGEAPGADEDEQGKPFVGAAGELLGKMIGAMGLSREGVYIANVLKCRPDMPEGVPGNRKPTKEEMEECLPFLRRQIEIVRPRVMVALGATAMQGLFGRTEAMARLRAQWHDFGGIPVMATYHPSYLLRNQAATEKRKVWEDLLKVMDRLGLPISEKQRRFFLPKQD
jgi:uracil-DNA glycosylase family 4